MTIYTEIRWFDRPLSLSAFEAKFETKSRAIAKKRANVKILSKILRTHHPRTCAFLSAYTVRSEPMTNSNAIESNAPLSSVPISLYRELCDELRHKNAELEATNQQNQRLLQQNQQLRQELHQLVQRVVQTQQVVTQMATDDLSQPALSSVMPARSVHRQVMRSVQDQNPAATSPSDLESIGTIGPQPLPIPIVSPNPLKSPPSKSPEWINAEPDSLATRLWTQTSTFTQDLQGWKLAVMMGVIVFSAFGAGFLIVRPFMAQQHLQQAQPQQPRR